MRNYTKHGEADFELFNLIGDPSEEQHLVDQQPEIAARMRRQLDAWNQSVDRSITGADYPEGKVLPAGRKATEKKSVSQSKSPDETGKKKPAQEKEDLKKGN